MTDAPTPSSPPIVPPRLGDMSATQAGALGAEVRRAAAEARAVEAEARAARAEAEAVAMRAAIRAEVWRLVEVMHDERRLGEDGRTARQLGRIVDETWRADHG